MSFNILIKRLLVVFIAALFFAAPSWAAGSPAGKIAKLSGEVSYRKMNNIPYQPAKKDTQLEQGYWIKTGTDGWASVELSDGSKLTLANGTELEITEFVIGKGKKDGVFSITKGKLRASVTRLAGEKVNYKVKSPTAVAGVRGTEFMIMTEGPANVFFGNEGSADVSGDAASHKALSADTMVQNTRGYIPTDTVKVEPGTPLYEAKKGFENITAAAPPSDWEASGNLPHIIARWNINHGHYLADSGKYDDALYVFQIALDLTSLPELRGDARLERGAVYSRFLRNSEAALSEYLLVLEEYPSGTQRETALYLVGMTLYELGFKAQAKERLLQYKREYPGGKHVNNVDTILGIIDK
ncbi:MAG: FecR domain-containing protein [Thermodesulfovibrionales bacterium]|nr:FecR domain-containing protein [Thermodesulfovibrionales bacterium]